MSRLLTAVSAADRQIEHVATLSGIAPGDRLQQLHTLRRRLEERITKLSGEVAAQVAAASKPGREAMR